MSRDTFWTNHVASFNAEVEQDLLIIVQQAADDISKSFNTRKMVCMIFNPSNRRKIVCNSFPAFSFAGCQLLFVQQFKYLGHIIDKSLSDDAEIGRELKPLFIRTNVLCRRFKRCSTQIKVQLFRSFCVWFCDTALWCNLTSSAMNKLASSYCKCINIFFSVDKYSYNDVAELGIAKF